MERLGAEPVSSQDADIVVVNTCSVTAEAERDARAYIRRAQRQRPGARIVVTGCYAQRASQEIAALDGVHAVVQNSQKHRTAEVSLRDSSHLGLPQTPAWFRSLPLPRHQLAPPPKCRELLLS